MQLFIGFCKQNVNAVSTIAEKSSSHTVSSILEFAESFKMNGILSAVQHLYLGRKITNVTNSPLCFRTEDDHFNGT